MSSRFIMPYQYAYDEEGLPLQGAKLYFYESGTSTLVTVYTDEALTIPNTNPVISDPTGNFGNIFLAADIYKVVLKTALDIEVFTADPVIVTDNFTAGAGLININNALTTAILTNNQTGTTYTVVPTDRSKLVTHNNVNPVVVTLPNPSTPDFPLGWYYYTKNNGSNIVTISCSIATIDGLSSIRLESGEGALIVSDGVNYKTFRDSVVLHNLPSKPILVDLDEFLLADSAASFVSKKIIKSDLVKNIIPITTRGDIVVGNATPIPARLGLGSSGQSLISNGVDLIYDRRTLNIMKGVNQSFASLGNDNQLRFEMDPNRTYFVTIWVSSSNGPWLGMGISATGAIASILGQYESYSPNGANSALVVGTFSALSNNITTAGQQYIANTFRFKVVNANTPNNIISLAVNGAGIGVTILAASNMVVRTEGF